MLVYSLGHANEQLYRMTNTRGRQVARRGKSLTVRISRAFQLAEEDREILFDRLERFANLGDSPEEYRRFRLDYPSFTPGEYSPGSVYPADPERVHLIVLGHRDCLRDLWRGCDGPNKPEVASAALAWLLDLKLSIPVDVVGRYYKRYAIGSVARTGDACLVPNWWAGAGQVSYGTSSEFSRAVFLLWQESWRARVCRECGRYFIAGKPAQLYCSTTCYGTSKHARDLSWWRTHGAAMRKAKRRVKVDRRGGK